MNEIGINRISPSMLVEYENCPRLFYFRSWLGLKLPQQQMHLRFGTAFHLAIDEIYECRENGTWEGKTSDSAIEKFTGSFTTDAVDIIDFDTETERKTKYDEMLANGIELVKAFWAEKDMLLHEKGIDPTQFEIPIKMKPWNPDTKELLELPVSCRIDAIAVGHKVVEFKTSSQLYDVFATRGSLQTLTYVWVYYCTYGIIPSIDFVVALKKRKRDKIQHLSFTYTINDILAHDVKVRSIIDKIRNREFERPYANHPFFCDCKRFEELLYKQ